MTRVRAGGAATARALVLRLRAPAGAEHAGERGRRVEVMMDGCGPVCAAQVEERRITRGRRVPLPTPGSRRPGPPEEES